MFPYPLVLLYHLTSRVPLGTSHGLPTIQPMVISFGDGCIICPAWHCKLKTAGWLVQTPRVLSISMGRTAHLTDRITGSLASGHIRPPPPSIALASATLSSLAVATFTWSPSPSLLFFSMTIKVNTRMSGSRVQDGWMRRHVLKWPLNTPLETCEGLCSYMALTLPVRT